MNDESNKYLFGSVVTKNVEVGKGMDVERHANLYRRQRGGRRDAGCITDHSLLASLRTNFKLSMDQWVKIKVL